jgi:hypothetical protein
MVQSPPSILDAAAKVEELIDHDRKGWNLSLLSETFNEEDRVAIQSVPISCTNQPDKLVWGGNKNGVFSVSSAYHMAKEQESANQPESSIRRGNNFFMERDMEYASCGGLARTYYRLLEGETFSCKHSTRINTYEE